MIFYHSTFDIYYFGAALLGVSWDLKDIVKGCLPDLIGTLFFLVLGVSAWLRVQTSPSINYTYKGFLRRGLQILFWALLITLISRTFFPQGVVYFGVLHCLGVSLLLLPTVMTLQYMNLVLGVAVIGLGIFIQSVPVSTPWFLWLGLIPKDTFFGDYFPLLPWFGVSMIGVFFGKIFYPHLRKKEWKEHWKRFVLTRALGCLGRHSLLIYLVHQPLILAGLFILGELRHLLAALL